MALKITDKPNALPVSGTYPYGDIKDNSGSGDGVPVNRVVYADFHQFFARIADLAGIVLNSLPDNAVNSWQFVTALQTLIANAVSSEASIRSAADTTLQNNINSEAATRLAVDNAIKAITLTAGAGLSGGGDLTANRTFDVNVDGATLEINTDIVRVKDSGITNAKLGVSSVSSSKIADGAAIKINVAAPPMSAHQLLISNWDMDTNATYLLNHGLTAANILSVNILIQDSAVGKFYDLTEAGKIVINNTQLELSRTAAGTFDNASFVNTAIKILIIYTP